MKIIFFGSDDFAAESLSRLVKEGFDVVGCVTQPDRAAGRGLKMGFSPIKTIALAQKLPVLQPESLKDEVFLRELKGFGADLFIVIAYGKILPSAILDIPKLFAINVHGSLLPKYRGAAPVNWAIINGEKETGFTIMKLNPKMDAGDIIIQEKMSISDEETAAHLRERMAKLSASCLCRTVYDIAAARFKLTPQDQTKVTTAPKLTKELGKIDWNKSAIEIHNLIRGLLPWPGAFCSYQGKTFKILRSAVSVQSVSVSPGSILQINKEGILVATGKNALLIKEVHPESSKIVSAQAFASGQRLKAGHIFT